MGTSSRVFGQVPMDEGVATPEDIAVYVKGDQSMKDSVPNDVVQLTQHVNGYIPCKFYQFDDVTKTWVEVQHQPDDSLVFPDGIFCRLEEASNGSIKLLIHTTKIVDLGTGHLEIYVKRPEGEVYLVSFVGSIDCVTEDRIVSLPMDKDYYQDGEIEGRYIKGLDRVDHIFEDSNL